MENLIRFYETDIVDSLEFCSIEAVLLPDTIDPDWLLQYRVGKKCYISPTSLEIGQPLIVMYEDKSHFGGGIIKRVNFDGTGYWVTTRANSYRFELERKDAFNNYTSNIA